MFQWLHAPKVDGIEYFMMIEGVPFLIIQDEGGELTEPVSTERPVL